MTSADNEPQPPAAATPKAAPAAAQPVIGEMSDGASPTAPAEGALPAETDVLDAASDAHEGGLRELAIATRDAATQMQSAIALFAQAFSQLTQVHQHDMKAITNIYDGVRHESQNSQKIMEQLTEVVERLSESSSRPPSTFGGSSDDKILQYPLSSKEVEKYPLQISFFNHHAQAASFLNYLGLKHLLVAELSKIPVKDLAASCSSTHPDGSENPHGTRLQKVDRWLARCFLQCVDETYAKSRNFMAAINIKDDAQAIRISGIRLLTEASAYVVPKTPDEVTEINEEFDQRQVFSTSKDRDENYEAASEHIKLYRRFVSRPQGWQNETRLLLSKIPSSHQRLLKQLESEFINSTITEATQKKTVHELTRIICAQISRRTDPAVHTTPTRMSPAASAMTRAPLAVECDDDDKDENDVETEPTEDDLIHELNAYAASAGLSKKCFQCGKDLPAAHPIGVRFCKAKCTRKECGKGFCPASYGGQCAMLLKTWKPQNNAIGKLLPRRLNDLLKQAWEEQQREKRTPIGNRRRPPSRLSAQAANMISAYLESDDEQETPDFSAISARTSMQDLLDNAESELNGWSASAVDFEKLQGNMSELQDVATTSCDDADSCASHDTFDIARCAFVSYGDRSDTTWECSFTSVNSVSLSRLSREIHRQVSDAIEEAKNIYSDECQFETSASVTFKIAFVSTPDQPDADDDDPILEDNTLADSLSSNIDQHAHDGTMSPPRTPRQWKWQPKTWKLTSSELPATSKKARKNFRALQRGRATPILQTIPHVLASKRKARYLRHELQYGRHPLEVVSNAVLAWNFRRRFAILMHRRKSKAIASINSALRTFFNKIVAQRRATAHLTRCNTHLTQQNQRDQSQFEELLQSCVSTVDLRYVAELAPARMLELSMCTSPVRGNRHIIGPKAKISMSYFHDLHIQDLLMRSRKLPRDINSDSVVMSDVLWNVRTSNTPTTHSDQILCQLYGHVSQGELSHAATQLIAFVNGDPQSFKRLGSSLPMALF